MSRRTSFLVVAERLAREHVRRQRQAELARQRHAREQVRLRREQLRLNAQRDKQLLKHYQESRATEASEMNSEMQARMDALSSILEASLDADPRINFDSLRLSEDLPEFVPPKNFAVAQTPPQLEDFTRSVKPMSGFEKLLSRSGRYQRDLHQAQILFAQAQAQYAAVEADRQKLLSNLRADHEAENVCRLAEIQERNSEVSQTEWAYRSGEPAAVVAYCSLVLNQSIYPDEFPREGKTAFIPPSKELVVDFELPTADVVPTVADYRYVKTKDLIEEKPRKSPEIKEIYRDIVAAIALRTINELLRADQGSHIDVVVFNGFVNAVDPATGQNIKPYLISVRATRARFEEIDLRRIEKKACLRNLGAHVSTQPTELLAIKPIVDFEMVDKRFVEGSDVLADLESRPNLMDLTPFEFEQLVGNLFTKMGLTSKQTRSSRDGGVDVVAWDMRPVVGGKVVIQAKRYRHTVGVSAVRDLFGTMNHEGANKGILVTTSSYGPDAYDFVRGKPIELIDGGGLLYYLQQHAEIEARIVFPVEDK